jgi:hypothetical protein
MQLRIAVHELGHAAEWKDLGLHVVEIVHVGDDGHCRVQWRAKDDYSYAAGCWGGLEAEIRRCRGNSGSERPTGVKPASGPSRRGTAAKSASRLARSERA